MKFRKSGSSTKSYAPNHSTGMDFGHSLFPLRYVLDNIEEKRILMGVGKFMNERFRSGKERRSTKDRFVSMAKTGGYPRDERIPWYRRSNLFYPLLMIIVFTFLFMAARVISQVNKQWQEDAVSEEELDYETAREIFQSSGDKTSEESE